MQFKHRNKFQLVVRDFFVLFTLPILKFRSASPSFLVQKHRRCTRCTRVVRARLIAQLRMPRQVRCQFIRAPPVYNSLFLSFLSLLPFPLALIVHSTGTHTHTHTHTSNSLTLLRLYLPHLSAAIPPTVRSRILHTAAFSWSVSRTPENRSRLFTTTFLHSSVSRLHLLGHLPVISAFRASARKCTRLFVTRSHCLIPSELYLCLFYIYTERHFTAICELNFTNAAAAIGYGCNDSFYCCSGRKY